jgi:xanthine dehydrogenase accessory factor
VKHWRETREVLDALDAVVRAGRRAALATVTGVRGSAYRRPGAKLLIADDGVTTGNISGGCLEQDVREIGLQVIASGVAQQRTYHSRADDDLWGLGLGCEGEVDVFIEPAFAARPDVRARLDHRTPFTIRTVLPDGSGFEDVLVPPPRLAIYGKGVDTLPLARLAGEVGFDLGHDRPDYAIVMTHNFAHDCEHVRALLAAEVPYIGLLGPRRRTRRLLDALAVDEAGRARVHGPVGLDLGAYGAEQIAVSIVAELLSRVRDRPRMLDPTCARSSPSSAPLL